MNPPSTHQKALTEKCILPNIDTILYDLIAIRKDIVDEKLKKDPKVLNLLTYWKKEYPIGLCAEIRNEMLNQIFDPANALRYSGIKIIMDFVREGGMVIPFWGVDKDLYFENAILIGDSVLDVANDTVYIYKNPVEFYPSLETSPLKIIQSFDKVAEIAEKYWNYEIYPNIYFPHLAPAFPIIAIVKAHRAGGFVNGLIVMGDFVDLHTRNLNTISDGYLWGLAYNFLHKSDYSKKRLPRKVLDNLVTQYSRQNFKGVYKEMFRLSTDPKDVTSVFEHYKLHHTHTTIPSTILEKISTMENAGNKIKGIILATVTP